MSEDLLEMMATTDDDALQLEGPRMYISQRAPQDFVGKVVECGIDVHNNPKSALNGEKYFRLNLEVVEGDAVASIKEDSGWSSFEAKVGDNLGTTIEMAKSGIAPNKAKAIFRNLTEMASAFSEGTYRSGDFYPGKEPGPLGIRDEVFADPSEYVGRLVHVTTTQNGDWHNPSFELVPETKKKKKKAS